MNETKHPKVGLGTFIFKDNHFLMGLRKGAHGSGNWGLPGGHVEWFETFESTAIREIEEETNLNVTNVRFVTATNDIFEEEQKHYITIFMAAEWQSNEPQIMEPDKCLEWRWFEWGSNLPNNLFIPVGNFMKLSVDPRPILKAA